ncbi:MAG: FAD-dependent oxidoreductase [Actinomycetota bacterium]
MSQHVNEHHDVVVVGAGLAGLRCAADLAAAGADVVVLEARQRVGGRVFSHRFDDGQWCERGAEFIDANHVRVLGLAAELGLRITERDGEIAPRTALVDAAGRAVPMHLHASLADDLQRWEHALDTLRDDDALEHATLDDLMRSLPLSAVSRLVIGRDIRTEYMLPPDSVSQRFAAHLCRCNDRAFANATVWWEVSTNWRQASPLGWAIGCTWAGLWARSTRSRAAW